MKTNTDAIDAYFKETRFGKTVLQTKAEEQFTALKRDNQSMREKIGEAVGILREFPTPLNEFDKALNILTGLIPPEK
jgi:hypothetical protein